MKTEVMMKSTRKLASAYGDTGKADFQRGRRGREWWNYQTREYEKMNKRQPVRIYQLEEV